MRTVPTFREQRFNKVACARVSYTSRSASAAVGAHARVGRRVGILLIGAERACFAEAAIGAAVLPRVNDEIVALEMVVGAGQIMAAALGAVTDDGAVARHDN